MKLKKIVALALATATTVSLVACGSTSSAPAASTASTEAAATEEASAEEASTEEAAVEETASTGELHPCRIIQPGTAPTDYQTGIDAVNAKLAEDGVDIEVSVTFIPWDVYSEKLNLMLSTGEPFEILQVMQDVKNISSIAGMGAIIPVTDYIDKYPDLKAKFDDIAWASTLYNGEYYAIPDYWTSFDKTMAYMHYRADIAKEVGYDEFPQTVEGIIDLMEKSQAAILEESGIKAYNWFHQNQDTAHWLHRSYDTYPFYVENSLGLVLCRQDGTIDSFYESDEFKQDCAVYREIYEKGLINPDILNIDHDTMYDDAEYGAFLPSNTFDCNEGVTANENLGVDYIDVDWTRTFADKPDMIYTYGQNMNAVSSTSEDPETAFKFFNWLYGDQANFDLFHYGIEGVHYTLDDNGRITQTKDDAGSALYSMATWETGYIPMIRWSTETTDDYIDYYNYQSKDYYISPIAGFIFDASNVLTEQTNLQTELMASIYPIKFGIVDYDSNIDAAIEKLKAAGLDTYLEEYRRQFKEYCDANPSVLEEASYEHIITD